MVKSFGHEGTFTPVPGRLVVLLGRIDRSAGQEMLYGHQLPELLGGLAEQARIESITASSAIEGVVVASQRAAGIAAHRSMRFRNRNEREFAGYTDALDYLHRENPGPVTVGLVLHLHRLLFGHVEGGGGRFKADDNLVVDRLADGTAEIRFRPVPARETEFFMGELVERYRAASADGSVHPLVLVAAFALDFLVIHPFADGNGRVARILTGRLLEEHGYGVGRYVSIEGLVYEARAGYYDALGASTEGWHDGRHSIWPWVTYLAERLIEAYERFEGRIAAERGGGTKQQRVRDWVLLHAPSEFRIADVRAALPGVSDQTIRLALNELRDAGRITPTSTGRSATWRRA
jgi:Fic family protein